MKQIYIPIHQFAGFMGYCEIKIINHYHIGISPRMTQEKIMGQKIHKALEEADKLVPREKATKQQLKDPGVNLDFPREEIKVAIDRSPFIYIGRLDKFIRLNGDAIIVDDKVSKSEKIYKKPFPDKIIQLCCYCEGFLQAYNNTMSFNKILLRVVQRDINGNILYEYEEEYDESLKKFLLDKFQRFEDIYNQKVQPDHCNNINKCTACSYSDGCQWALK